MSENQKICQYCIHNSICPLINGLAEIVESHPEFFKWEEMDIGRTIQGIGVSVGEHCKKRIDVKRLKEKGDD